MLVVDDCNWAYGAAAVEGDGAAVAVVGEDADMRIVDSELEPVVVLVADNEQQLAPVVSVAGVVV